MFDFVVIAIESQKTEMTWNRSLATNTPLEYPMSAVGISGPDLVIADSHIIKTAGVCGGFARVKGTRIPVWGLARARGQNLSDSVILSMYPCLSLADLSAAWQYVDAHKADIDNQIAANEG